MQEAYGIVAVAHEGVAAAAGGEIAVEVLVLAHEFGDYALLLDRIGRIAGAVGGFFQAGDFGPEFGTVAEEFEFREAAEGEFELGQSRIVVQAVGAADGMGGIEAEGQAHGFHVPKEILYAGIEEGQIGHDFSHAFTALILVVSQPYIQGGLGPVADSPGIDIAEGKEASSGLACHGQDIFIGLGEVDFRADQRLDASSFDTHFVVSSQDFFGPAEVDGPVLRRARSVGMNMNIDEGGHDSRVLSGWRWFPTTNRAGRLRRWHRS